MHVEEEYNQTNMHCQAVFTRTLKKLQKEILLSTLPTSIYIKKARLHIFMNMEPCAKNTR